MEGRRQGLAVAALVVALVSFLSLLGMEKAITAIALAIVAISGAPAGSQPRKLGTAAIAVAALHLVTVAVVLIVFWDKVIEFVKLFEQLS
jgi:hypothetical protein